MLSSGEASGDLYAGALARELRTLDPGIVLTGFGGERMQQAGVDLIGDYHGISVTGLVEVLRVLPRTWQMYRRLLASASASSQTSLSPSISRTSISASGRR